MRMNKKTVFLIGVALLGVVGLWAAWDVFGDLPDPQTISERLNTPSVRFEDRHGRLLYEATPHDGGRHRVAGLDEIPLACRQATVAVEDRSFYRNPGVDLGGVLRAAWLNLRSGETVSGGSTITQQAARNLLLEAGERSERTLRRKLREAVLAVRLTQQFSKDDVLALYLNQTYYGGMAYGLAAAAQTFFASPVDQLDLAQCAMLAGLPQAPARYNPFTDLEAAKARQAVVLHLMQQAGMISAEQAQAAQREPLILAETPYPIEAPHFIMMARAQIDALFTPEQIYAAGGLVVRTTLNLDWQGLAEDAIQRRLEILRGQDGGLGHNVNSAALAALDPNSGEVLALVGSADYFDARHAGALNMAMAPLQPGSALKPLVYAAALDPRYADGPPWTAATMLLDIAQPFQTAAGQAFNPTNYNFAEHGPVSLRTALGSSLNIPAVLTLQHVGVNRLTSLAGALGLTTLQGGETYDLSLALGGGRVRLLELTAAYAAFANTGFRVSPQILLEVRSGRGDVLYAPPPAVQERVLDERLAWLISDILSDDQARSLGFDAHSVLEIGRPAAVKTGTTSNFHDNWTVGYTPQVVVGVWAGNPNYESMRNVTGMTGAAPIWHSFIRAALVGQPVLPFVRPAGLHRMQVCAVSGMLPSPACPYTRLEWFMEGTEPRQPDTLYVNQIIDRRTGMLAGDSTPPDQRQTLTALDLPPIAQAWAQRQGVRLASEFAPLAYRHGGQPGVVGKSGFPSAPGGPPTQPSPAGDLRLLSPTSGSVYQISPSAPADTQLLRIEAAGSAQLQEVRIYVDGVVCAAGGALPFSAWWKLTAGEHTLWAEGVLPDGSLVLGPRVHVTVKP